MALLLGVLGSLLIAEIGLRIYTASRGWTPNCYATGLAFFIPHRTAGYTLRPELNLKSTSYDVTVNVAGFRGPPVRDDPTQRIVVLGGSSVFGYLVADGQDSCRLLEQALNRQADGFLRTAVGGKPELPFEVLNAGVPGYNLTQCCERYQADIAALEPDWVVLYLGWNDMPFLIADDPSELNRTPPAPPWWQRSLSHSVLYGFLRYRLFPAQTPVFAPPAHASRTVTPAGGSAFTHELDRLIETIEATGATPIVCTQLTASAADCQGLESFLGADPAQVEANREVGRWITNELRRVATAHDLPLIDCAAELPCNSEFLGDAIHLTEAGHRAVADCWAERLATICLGVPPSSGADTLQGAAP